MTLTFLVSRTYSECTPESADIGVFSDTGFVFENREFTLRELIDYIKREGFENEGSSWLSTPWDLIGYSTATEGQDSLHIKLKVG